jgi:autoinducer 2-degrading protein
MVVYCVQVQVRKGHEEEFRAATLTNHEATRRELGNIRFDVLQAEEDSGRFFLYEVYRSDEAVSAHKETPHYKAWRETVEPWMAKKRVGTKYRVHAPTKRDAW